MKAEKLLIVMVKEEKKKFCSFPSQTLYNGRGLQNTQRNSFSFFFLMNKQ